MPALLSGALGFVFPSLYEGFGMPVLEAMTVGVPVIAANRGALPEVLDGAGTLIEPDDVVGFSDTLSTMLTLLGGAVRTAYDGRAAVEVGATFRPNVVLLDLGMPQPNGFDTCRLIRDQSWGRDVAVIAVSGWAQEEDKRRSLESGFDDHLIKPVAPSDLIRVLSGILTA